MHTLTNANGLIVRLIDRGAAIVQCHVPDRDGNLADITLGYDDEAGYEGDPYFLGAIAGRCANRIAGGIFTLDGEDRGLPINDPPNHLHGGPCGFDKRIWAGGSIEDPRGSAVRFSRTSPTGEEGYPGTLEASVTYVLTDADELICEMRATSDAPTLCNLAQHAYWNLAGHDAGTIEDHELTVFAEAMTPKDATGIPTGELAPVAGTVFDFRGATRVGDRLGEVGDEPRGYDHNYAVDGEPRTLRPVAVLRDPASGRVMSLSADQPGVQVYTGNYLDGSRAGKGGVAYGRHAGMCLETQCFPDAINKPGWVQPVLRPGETYAHTMVFAFSARG